MNIQTQIKRTLSQPASVGYVRELLDGNEFLHRSELAEALCEQLEFYDARGELQRSGCLKALRELEAAGHFILPAALSKTGGNSPRRLSEPLPPPTDVPERAGDVQGLRLVLVSTTEQMRIWNEMRISLTKRLNVCGGQSPSTWSLHGGLCS